MFVPPFLSFLINVHEMTNKLYELYGLLFSHFGPQHWWPGETPFEIMVGAVLTQNTNWSNVSRAIEGLKKENLLSFAALEAMPHAELAGRIRASGYFNLKAIRLKNLLSAICQDYEGDLDRLFGEETGRLRRWLLAVKGIGPETADSITLYAAGKPSFVVDAYTHRILFRHGLIPEEATYQEMQELFHDSLSADVNIFNEYHALLVALGKHFCKKRAPLCADCPAKQWTGFLVQ